MHFSKIEEYLGKNGACVSVFIVIFKLQQRELTLWDCFKYASVAMAMMEGQVRKIMLLGGKQNKTTPF